MGGFFDDIKRKLQGSKAKQKESDELLKDTEGKARAKIFDKANSPGGVQQLEDYQRRRPPAEAIPQGGAMRPTFVGDAIPSVLESVDPQGTQRRKAAAMSLYQKLMGSGQGDQDLDDAMRVARPRGRS